jgi:hypothetical protein
MEGIQENHKVSPEGQEGGFKERLLVALEGVSSTHIELLAKLAEGFNGSNADDIYTRIVQSLSTESRRSLDTVELRYIEQVTIPPVRPEQTAQLAQSLRIRIPTTIDDAEAPQASVRVYDVAIDTTIEQIHSSLKAAQPMTRGQVLAFCQIQPEGAYLFFMKEKGELRSVVVNNKEFGGVYPNHIGAISIGPENNIKVVVQL